MILINVEILYMILSYISSDYAQTRHRYSSIQHWHQVVCVFVSSSFQLLCFPSIQPFMVVYRLSFQCLYLCLQLYTFHLFFLFLSLRPLENFTCLLPVLSKLSLFFFIIFIGLAVFDLEFGYVVSGFVLMVLQVQFDDRTVANWQVFPFFHPFKGFYLKWGLLLATLLS